MQLLRYFALIILGLPAMAFGQFEYFMDITLVNTGTGQLEVRLRPQGDFDGFFAASVFTIRWLDASGADLQAPVMAIPIPVHYVGPSGERIIEGIYRYQVYAGFGNATLVSQGQNWTGGQEVLLCTITVPNDGTQFEIVNDDWAEANNGTYFISLNGFSWTDPNGVPHGAEGFIYSISTTVEETSEVYSLSVSPNPSNGLVTLILDGNGSDPLLLELFDAMGRSVWQDRRAMAQGNVRIPIDLSELSEGGYTLRVQNGTKLLHRHIVVAK